MIIDYIKTYELLVSKSNITQLEQQKSLFERHIDVFNTPSDIKILKMITNRIDELKCKQLT